MASLFLHEDFIIKTYLSPNQVCQKLSNEIEVGSFQGSVQENNFEIRRSIHYTNALKPIIRGSFSQELGLTKIAVTMTPDSSIKLFAIPWLGFAGFVFTCALGMWISTSLQKDLGEAVRNIGLFFGLGYILFITAFNLEAVPTKRRLKELFEGV